MHKMYGGTILVSLTVNICIDHLGGFMSMCDTNSELMTFIGVYVKLMAGRMA